MFRIHPRTLLKAALLPTALLLACEDAAFYIGATFDPNGGDIMA